MMPILQPNDSATPPPPPTAPRCRPTPADLPRTRVQTFKPWTRTWFPVATTCPHNYRVRRHLERPSRGDVGLVCFDMDGVLIRGGPSWVLIHEHFGVQNEGGYQSYMAGHIDDAEFIRTDVRLWTRSGPVHESTLEKILEVPDFMPGAHATIEALHDHGIKTAIVSGGLDYMANKVAAALGIDEVHANGLEVDPDGYLTGEGILRTPLCDKSVPLVHVAEKVGVDRGQVAAVGDSCPDTSMFEAAGLAIAFNPADECIPHVADAVVREPDLRKILPHIL